VYAQTENDPAQTYPSIYQPVLVVAEARLLRVLPGLANLDGGCNIVWIWMFW
jgi:hypothetical protein